MPHSSLISFLATKIAFTFEVSNSLPFQIGTQALEKKSTAPQHNHIHYILISNNPKGKNQKKKRTVKLKWNHKVFFFICFAETEHILEYASNPKGSKHACNRRIYDIKLTIRNQLTFSGVLQLGNTQIVQTVQRLPPYNAPESGKAGVDGI